MPRFPSAFPGDVIGRAEALLGEHFPAAVDRVIADASLQRNWSQQRTDALTNLAMQALYLCVNRGATMPDQSLALADLLRTDDDQPVSRADRKRVGRGLVQPIERVLSAFAVQTLQASVDVLGPPELVHLKAIESPSLGRAPECVAWQGLNPKTEAPFVWQVATIITASGAPIIAHVLPVAGPEFRLPSLRRAAGQAAEGRTPRSLAADKAEAHGVAEYPISTLDLFTMPHNELNSACEPLDEPELIKQALFIGGSLHVPSCMGHGLDMDSLGRDLKPLQTLSELGRTMIADLCLDRPDGTRVPGLSSLRWRLSGSGSGAQESYGGAELYTRLRTGAPPWERIQPPTAPQQAGIFWYAARGKAPDVGDITLLAGIDTLVRRRTATVRVAVGDLHGDQLRGAFQAAADDSFLLHHATTGAVAGAVRLAKRSGALHVQPRRDSGMALTSVVLCAATALLVAHAESEQQPAKAA